MIPQMVLKMLRETYTPGTRVELVQMDDAHAPDIGTQGTVIGVDAIGSIMVNWDNGSTLSVVWRVDRCKIIGE